MIHHYTRLGLKPGASEEEIKLSFRELAKKSHPDAKGGNGILFARVKEAYDALSDTSRRQSFEKFYGLQASAKQKSRWAFRQANPPRPPQAKKSAASRTGHDANRAGFQTGPAKPATPAEEPVITRLMSIAIPRFGRVLFENLHTTLVVDPTTADNLWETTLRKFNGQEPSRLAHHLIQIKVTGLRSEVHKVKALATDLGVMVRPEKTGVVGDQKNGKPAAPLLVRVTVPVGTSLLFRDVGGKITVGDVDGPLKARLSGTTILRAGNVRGAGLSLSGHSRAILLSVIGDADVLAGGYSQVLLDGRIARLRTVLEADGRMEILGAVGELLAEVGGRGLLHAKGVVTSAHCDTIDQGYLRIAELKNFLAGGGTRHIDVEKRSRFVPVGRPSWPTPRPTARS